MIKKLQRKIILIITVLLSIAVGVIMLMINIYAIHLVSKFQGIINMN